MSWSETLTEMGSRVGSCFGEPAQYTHSDLGENIDLPTAIWRVSTELADMEPGVIADATTVWIPAEDMKKADATLIEPQRMGTWKRYPGEAAEEVWNIVSPDGGPAVTKKAAGWLCWLQKAVRPVPR